MGRRTFHQLLLSHWCTTTTSLNPAYRRGTLCGEIPKQPTTTNESGKLRKAKEKLRETKGPQKCANPLQIQINNKFNSGGPGDGGKVLGFGHVEAIFNQLLLDHSGNDMLW